jgi:hypothetical protein
VRAPCEWGWSDARRSLGVGWCLSPPPPSDLTGFYLLLHFRSNWRNSFYDVTYYPISLLMRYLAVRRFPLDVRRSLAATIPERGENKQIIPIYKRRM